MTSAIPEVLEFYRRLPFNARVGVAEQAAAVTTRNPVTGYPPLVPLLTRDRRVVDIGCGPGGLANAIAYWYGCAVTGVDFNPVAIERAAVVARALNVSASFVTSDLFLYRPAERFDVVISLGVLHHTRDCLAGLAHLCDHLAAPSGAMFIGLYHRYARAPFLEHFARLKAGGASEDGLRREYARLDPELTDPVQRESWFRDQVLHPHETQHTLAEVLPVLTARGFSVTATSLNRFAQPVNLEAILRDEERMAEPARAALARAEYFPGFFLFLAQPQEGR